MNPRAELPHRARAVSPGLPVTLPPFDLYNSDRALFLVVNLKGQCLGLPLACLAEATLAPGNVLITLDFGNSTILIKGRSLAELYEAILLAKVRVIRPGTGAACSVTSIERREARLA